jgi:ubiquinol-cytochrome c reductase cytochrome c1 subunit
MSTKFICLFFLLALQDSQAFSSSINVPNKPSLQRGAKVYMNYCSGCHSLTYLSYRHMAEDLGLLNNKLMVTQASIDDSIRSAMPPEEAAQWFGVVPPDLSLIARKQGAQWLYQYLKSFYHDESQLFGTNNLLKPGLAMPNVLGPLIGEQILKNNNKGHYLSLVKGGALSRLQADEFLKDLITFLVYVGEPAQLIRYRIGLFVMGFLGIFLIVVIGLKKIYWKKIPR